MAVLNPVNPSIATTSTASRHACGWLASQVLNTCLERPSTMSNNRAGPVPSRIGVRSMITVTNLSPRRVWRHTCSSTPIARNAVEAGRVVDQHPSALGEHGVVGGVPRHPEPLGDTGDGQVLDDDPLQCPAQPAARQLRSRFGRRAGVLAPHVPATGAALAADRDHQDRRSPPERLMRQLALHRVTRRPVAAAAMTPPVRLDHPAGQHRPVRLEPLAGDFQTELVEPAERGQVSAGETRATSSVRQVEVSQMAGVRTPIIGETSTPFQGPSTPDLHPQSRRALNGRDEESRRWLGPESDDPAPMGCIEVGETMVGWIDVDADQTWLQPGEGNVRYCIFPDHRGRGYAARAARLLPTAMEAQGLRWALLVIDVANAASLGVARSSGARLRPERTVGGHQKLPTGGQRLLRQSEPHRGGFGIRLGRDRCETAVGRGSRGENGLRVVGLSSEAYRSSATSLWVVRHAHPARLHSRTLSGSTPACAQHRPGVPGRARVCQRRDISGLPRRVGAGSSHGTWPRECRARIARLIWPAWLAASCGRPGRVRAR